MSPFGRCSLNNMTGKARMITFLESISEVAYFDYAVDRNIHIYEGWDCIYLVCTNDFRFKFLLNILKTKTGKSNQNPLIFWEATALLVINMAISPQCSSHTSVNWLPQSTQIGFGPENVQAGDVVHPVPFGLKDVCSTECSLIGYFPLRPPCCVARIHPWCQQPLQDTGKQCLE